MSINRRQFLILTTTTAACAATGCVAMADNGGGPEQLIDAGPVGNFAADGVYSNFADVGFFVIRKAGKLSALSSICTHRDCKLTAETDRSFYCHCHGSTFDPSGKVTEGPAKRDLPVFPTFTDANGHLIVSISS